jgi:hypothetical protein
MNKMKLVNESLNSRYFISNIESLLFPYYIEKIDAQLLITFMQGLICPNNLINDYRESQKELYLMWILQESKNTIG